MIEKLHDTISEMIEDRDWEFPASSILTCQIPTNLFEICVWWEPTMITMFHIMWNGSTHYVHKNHPLTHFAKG